MPRPNIVRVNMNQAINSTAAKQRNVIGMRLVRPDCAFCATNSALVPKERMPWGMVASCLEFSVPCMKPLNTEEEPRVTIMAGSSK